MALVKATQRGARALRRSAATRTISSGVGDRHRAISGNHDHRRAQRVEAVDQPLGLLAGSGHEDRRPASGGSARHRSRAATSSPSASGSSMAARASARRTAPVDDQRGDEHQPPVFDPRPGAERQQAPAAEAGEHGALGGRPRSLCGVPARTCAEAADPVTASSAIAPCAGDGTKSAGSRRSVALARARDDRGPRTQARVRRPHRHRACAAGCRRCHASAPPAGRDTARRGARLGGRCSFRPSLPRGSSARDGRCRTRRHRADRLAGGRRPRSSPGASTDGSPWRCAPPFGAPSSRLRSSSAVNHPCPSSCSIGRWSRHPRSGRQGLDVSSPRRAVHARRAAACLSASALPRVASRKSRRVRGRHQRSSRNASRIASVVAGSPRLAEPGHRTVEQLAHHARVSSRRVRASPRRSHPRRRRSATPPELRTASAHSTSAAMVGAAVSRWLIAVMVRSSSTSMIRSAAGTVSRRCRAASVRRPSSSMSMRVTPGTPQLRGRCRAGPPCRRCTAAVVATALEPLDCGGVEHDRHAVGGRDDHIDAIGHLPSRARGTGSAPIVRASRRLDAPREVVMTEPPGREAGWRQAAHLAGADEQDALAVEVPQRCARHSLRSR